MNIYFKAGLLLFVFFLAYPITMLINSCNPYAVETKWRMIHLCELFEDIGSTACFIGSGLKEILLCT